MSEKYTKVFTDDIVISGMSGRFPESNTTDEFAYNLYNKVDMITEDNRRWPTDLYGMSARMGKLKDIDKFDGLFFGIMDTMADTIDPQSRLLLETTYEAIIDAGLNPQSMRGSETGVYIGYSSFGMPEGIPEETQPDSQNSMTETLLWIPGNSKCLYSNRISFVFDFKGPSLLIDTACSSSLVALNTAVNDLRLGKCDQAIVGGTQVCLQPFTNHIFQATHLNSSDGIPKIWDESADGFVRGETVACFLLQRRSDAKRIYATVLNSGVNIDGNKRMGMFFPSSESQEELMIKTYKEANVDPLKVNYFEAHATGTKVGDQQEAKAIYNAYCLKPKREGLLSIGLLKGNIGHSEGASGVSSVTKVLLAFENQCIPPNLHLKKLKSEIEEMSDMLSPINDCLPYTPGIAGINNFGIGGVNAHLLLEPNYKTLSQDSIRVADTIPRIINICSRTEESFNYFCKWIEDNPQKVSPDFLALLTDSMKVEPLISSTGFPIRGSLIIKKISEDKNQIQYEYKKQFSTFISKTIRQIWFVFPGLGCQWIAMAKSLMPIKIFADKIEECHQILKPFRIDLKNLLLSEDKSLMSSMTNKFCATTALEIALFDIMTTLNIIPDGIIGHSFGEIACAYADGCLTTKEALLITYYRGIVTESDKKVPKGLMAVIGLSWNDAKQLCPKSVDVVCNNAKNTVVISGIYDEIKEIVNEFNKKGVFVRELQSNYIPYHSQYLTSCAKRMTDEIKKVLPNPKLRSKRWTSTSVLDSDPEDVLKYASAEYFVHNLINPVYFYNKLKRLPSDAIVVEMGPHSLFARTVTETLDSSTYLSLMKRDSNDTNLDLFLSSIAKLYELGHNPSIDKLYPKVEWPVMRGTQSIGSLMRWDHKKTHFVRKYPDHYFRYTANDMNETIDLSRRFNHFLPDHCIDGNLIFPATGYLMLAWRQLAASKGRIWNQIPVIFEDVQFRRAVFLSDTDMTRLKVKLYDQSGEFAVLEHNNVCCCGKIRTPSEDNKHVLSVQKLIDKFGRRESISETNVCLTSNDIYKDLRIGGYDYGPFFRGLQSVSTEQFRTLEGTVLWNGNWITFTDSLLQSMAVAMPLRKMMIPVMIKSLRCDPRVLYEAVSQFKLNDESEQPFDEEQAFDDLVTPNNDKPQAFESESDFLEIDNNHLFEGVVGSKFHMYKSIVPFYANTTTRMIVTHGLEVEDLMAIPISRKTNVQDLKLEYYQFVANQDLNAIEECDRQYFNQYLKVCSSLAMKAKDLLGVNGTNCLNGNNKESQNVIKDFLMESNENHVLLKIFDRLLNVLTKDENQNFDEKNLKLLIEEILQSPEFDISRDLINQVSKNDPLIRTLLDIVSENNVPKKDLKLLEINLTNNLFAKEVDNHLASYAIYPIDVDYTIAVKSIELIPEDYKNKTFKLIEWQPKKSAFPSDITPKDLIILNFTQEVYNIDIKTHLQEIYDVIVSKGFLLTVFKYRQTEPELVLNTLIGNKSIDYENQIKVFIKEAKNIGFNIIGNKCDAISSMTVLFRKSNLNPIGLPKEEQVFQITDDCRLWFEILREKIRIINENDIKDQNIWLIANDSQINGIIGLINCLRLEPGGETIRCLFDCNQLIKFPVNFDEKPFSEILAKDLIINVLKDGKIGTYRHLNLPKDYDKIESDEYFLNVGQNRDLSSLQWFNSKNIKPLKERFDINNRKLDLINCQIYSSGLNFRDIMLATGRISSGAQNLFTDCVLGLEFAGRRTDSGERVMGFDMSRCFATSIDANSEFITQIPEHWSMDDGVTVLSTYSTVWYALIERAQLKKNESILIHSGAGGVGQAAINICQYYSCDIYVTVGTEEKRKFLITEYNIPENRIFSSRDIQFKFEIKAMTDGRGVDLVLNSLTGDKLEASYECVADCGRFVEIGKYDLQMNKQLGMFSLLKDISLIGVSVDHKLYNSKGFAKKFFDWMHQNCNNGCVKPITRTVFAAEDAEKAFRYMTTGKHIGKIVLKIRDEEFGIKTIDFIKPAKVLKTTTKTYFDEKKVYIITGGLGGIGLELIHWMLFLGARNFVLTSRYGIKTDYQKFIFRRAECLGNRFKMFGTKIIVSTHDTNCIEGSEQLIRDAQQLGTIGGVFHLTLVLNDCRFENQTIDKFCETVDSKTKIFENLDKLSRKMDLNLDYFVLFSSIVCGKGNAGQSNYGYANSVCERICETRRKDGLHGLAIQWGPIDDVGVLAESEILSSVSGIVKQRINSCFDILDKLLQNSHSVVSCYVRAKRISKCSTRESRICHQIWSSLGIDPKTTPENLTLGEIGMESMFAVELQQGLERDYEIKVSLNDIKSITIKQLKDFEVGKQEELRSFAEQIRIAREKLAKIKFIIPNETHTRLNGVKTGKPVYFLPPLEGIFASLEGLAERINRPVIGLNWTKQMDKMNSVKEMTQFYINLLNTIHPKGDYDIVGHFYGALISMRMLKKRAPVRRAVIIDILSDTKIDEQHIDDDHLIELITKFISKDLPQVMKDRLTREIKLKSDLNGKLEKISSEIKEFVGKSLISKDLDEILKNAFIRAKLFVNYRLNMKRKVKQIKQNVGQKYLQMNGKLLIIKPQELSEENNHIFDRIRDSYFLPEKGLEGRLNFETVDTNPEDISIKAFETIADKINNYLS